MYRTLAAILLALSLSSCDPGTPDHYFADNQSDSTIYVVYQRVSEYDGHKIDTCVFVASHSVVEFCRIGGVGHGDLGSDFLYSFEVLTMYTDTSTDRTIKKDHLNRGSWNYRQEKERGDGDKWKNVYTLSLTNDEV